MRRLPVARFAFLTMIAAGFAMASEPQADRVSLALGAFTSFQAPSSMAGIVEYQNGHNLLSGQAYLNPIGGVVSNTDHGVYVYAGLRLGFPLSSAWHWENGAGFGWYTAGNGPELYDPLEFCLILAITREIRPDLRVGLEAFHVSNAGLRDQDPGANSFVALAEFAI